MADVILAQRPLSDLHREFIQRLQPLNVAYVDLKSAFGSVDREALWKAVGGIGSIIGAPDNTAQPHPVCINPGIFTDSPRQTPFP